MTQVKNKIISTVLAAITVLGGEALGAPSGQFTFENVIEIARQASERPFEEVSDRDVPETLKRIGYDEYRDFRFNNAKTLWQDRPAPFRVRFFHLGFLYTKPVKINVVEAGVSRPYPFSKSLFDYRQVKIPTDFPEDMGFAGFRVHHPINNKDEWDEVAAFLGASFFRAVAKDLHYGLSARGLAVNTAIESGEEFPIFREFWLVEPGSRDRQITIWAHLDGPSVSGAYQFVIEPGRTTLMHVKSALFFRKKVAKLGVAPLTSMFFYGEMTKHQGDFRPEVHDSDGAVILTDKGEWIWRPLVNPERLTINTYEVGAPRGFGLLQRDRNFDHYQDLEARMDNRPSAWVIPEGDWGPGHVELLHLPTPSEFNDNINLYWVPKTPPEAGERRDYSYSLSWFGSTGREPRRGITIATRVVRENARARFVIDFAGAPLTDEKKAEARINVGKDFRLVEHQVIHNTVTGGLRLVFVIESQKDPSLADRLTNEKRSVDLSAYLASRDKPLTETWTYTYQP